MDQLHNQLLENNNSYKQWHEHRSHKIIHFLIFIMVAIVGTGTLLNVINKSDASSTRSSVRHNPFESLNFEARMNGKSELRGEEAIAALGGDISTVAKYYKLDAQGLRNGFRNDSSLAVNKNALLLYADPVMPEASTPGDGVIANNPTPDQIPDSETFRLHSRPSAIARIYLDFDGATTTHYQWVSYNNGNTIVSAPYNTDGVAGFSPAEMLQIRKMWLSVAEDYAPYNVDVTTEFSNNPPDIYKYAHMIISPTTWKSGVGGIAYTGSFTWGDNPGAFAFTTPLANNSKYISEVISHEAGHMLGLSHTSRFDANCVLQETYHLGSAGTGNPGWAPIMGNSYYRGVTSWVNSSEVPDAGTPFGCNVDQNQFQIITTQNGFSYATDEAGSTTATAPVLLTTSGGSAVDTIGVLTQSDVDLYKFTTTGGDINFTVKPVQLATSTMLGNADFRVRLLNSSQQVLAESNPVAVATATVSKSAAPSGTYYLEIAASNYLDFTQAGGYSVSGSMGKYQITGSYSASSDTTAPVVTFNSPVGTLSATVTFTATATDNIGVTKVEFYRGTTLIGTDTTSPYSTTFDTTTVANGTYNFMAKAYDLAGNIGSSSIVSIAIYNPPAPDNTPPIVSITSPSNGANLSASTYITADASDNVGVDHIDFYRNNDLIGADATYPYSMHWDTTQTSNGTYNISAIAYDASTNSGYASPVSVSVFNVIDPPPDTTLPTVSMTSPVNGATVSGPTTLSADANDNVGVTMVSFFNGPTLIDTDTTPPYAITWNTASVANGTYPISAKAYDAASNSANSGIVNVTVSNVIVGMPQANILAPTNGLTITGTKYTIKTSASDDVAVTKMEIFINNKRQIASTPNTPTATLYYDWDTSRRIRNEQTSGTFTIMLKVYDASNNVTTKSVTVYK